MAFLDTTKTITLTDTYSTHSKTITLTVTISAAGVISWSATTTGETGNTSLYLKIDNTELYKKHYYKNDSFPRKKNTSANSTFTMANTSAKTVAIDFRLCFYQDASSGTRWEDKDVTQIYTTPITRVTSGSAPSLYLEDYGNNQCKLYGKLGKNGTGNEMSSAAIYYTTNGLAPDTTKTYTKRIELTATSEGNYEKYINITSKCTVKAITYCRYEKESASVSSGEKSCGCTYHSSMTGSPTVTIEDNDNNSFTITYSGCAAGTANSVTTTCKYGYDSANSSYTISPSPYTTTVAMSNRANAKRTVKAIVTSKPAWTHDSRYNSGSGVTAEASADIVQYCTPEFNSTKHAITLAEESRQNGRLTIKRNWTFNWDAATRANASSEVRGYRVRVYKSGTPIAGLRYDNNTDAFIYLQKPVPAGAVNYVDVTTTSITFNPATLGFVPGDTVAVSVDAYTTNGKNEITWSVGTTKYSMLSSSRNGGVLVSSEVYPVENAGIMRVYTSTGFKEAPVKVYLGPGKGVDGWVEAEVVKVCTGFDSSGKAIWKEST